MSSQSLNRSRVGIRKVCPDNVESKKKWRKPWVSTVFTCPPQPGRCSTLTIVVVVVVVVIIIIIITIIIIIIFIFMRGQNSPPSMNNMFTWGITSTFLHEGSKFATPYEQYVDWGDNRNFIFMRDRNLPPTMNNMLTGVITSTLSSWGIEICHPLWTNMFTGIITLTLSS